MTLQFPSSPINGAVSGDYTYDATKGAWRKNAALPVSVTHSDVAPSNPREGDQWWKSDEGTLFTYYNDGNSSQWVESTNVIANVEPNPIPAGAMMAWGSDAIPSNWLLCDGSAVSRSTYASLFSAIGTQYGSGDGTTTFNLPDIKGKTIVGKDSGQTEFNTLVETGGAKTHTLTTAEMPSHTHTQNAHTHTQDAHSHNIGSAADISSTTGAGNVFAGSTGSIISGTATATNQNTTATNQNTTATNQNTGGGGAHNNLQPYIVVYMWKRTS
jgi:microcystin-dependent protein